MRVESNRKKKALTEQETRRETLDELMHMPLFPLLISEQAAMFCQFSNSRLQELCKLVSDPSSNVETEDRSLILNSNIKLQKCVHKFSTFSIKCILPEIISEKNLHKMYNLPKNPDIDSIKSKISITLTLLCHHICTLRFENSDFNKFALCVDELESEYVQNIDFTNEIVYNELTGYLDSDTHHGFIRVDRATAINTSILENKISQWKAFMQHNERAFLDTHPIDYCKSDCNEIENFYKSIRKSFIIMPLYLI